MGRWRPERLKTMALIRSIIHMLWMAITAVPYTLAIVLGSLFGMRGTSLAPHCPRLAVALRAQRSSAAGHPVPRHRHGAPAPGREKRCGVAVRTSPRTRRFDASHHAAPLAYVFKKELLYVPFFGWSIGRLDMIHIDRSLRAKAFNKVVQQGAKRCWPRAPGSSCSPKARAWSAGKGPVQERRHPAGHRHRRAGDSDCRHIGQGVAPQGLHQKAGRGGCVHRPRHCPRPVASPMS